MIQFRLSKLNIILSTVIVFFILFITIFVGKTFDFSFAKAKWDIKQKAIELRDGKVPFIESSKNPNGIDYKMLNELTLSSDVAKLIIPVSKFFDKGSLIPTTNELALPKQLNKSEAACAINWKLNMDLYLVDRGLFNQEQRLIFFNQELPSASLKISVLESEHCALNKVFFLEKTGTEWLVKQNFEVPLLPDENQYPAHFDIVNSNQIYLVSSDGKFYFRDLTDDDNNWTTLPIKINFDVKMNPPEAGIKDILVGRDNLFYSLASSRNDCLMFEIYRVPLRKLVSISKVANPERIYGTPNCLNRDTTNLNAVGGRLMFSNTDKSKMYFTLGNAEIWFGNENIESQKNLGTINILDLANKSIEVISFGHRNPQGICQIGPNLYSSEQGPDGGDELNLIVKGMNYGWPNTSFGVPYGNFTIPKTGSKSFGLHKGFAAPLFSWVPSIAAGDLFCPTLKVPKLWEGNLLLATLKDTSIRRLVLDNQSIVLDERIPMGARIRDLTFDENGSMWTISDWGPLVRTTFLQR